ncbi:excinuclease ABC subunit C domain-containing protein [Rhizobium sp. NXC14]|nr:excinuclease ABC subunit C domain-containing protein [Rhizobium sp. NXC14]
MEVTVYILRCSDGSYYTGLTKQEIEARVWEHNAATYDGYTAKRLPVELVFTETYDRIICHHPRAADQRLVAPQKGGVDRLGLRGAARFVQTGVG